MCGRVFKDPCNRGKHKQNWIFLILATSTYFAYLQCMVRWDYMGRVSILKCR